MAWQRTALGVGGVSALLLHESDGVLAALPGFLGLAVTVALLVLTEVRYERTVHRIGSGHDPSAAPLVALLAGTVTSLAVLALALVVVRG